MCRHQGESDVQTNKVSGNSATASGYGCQLPELIRIWRKEWSAVPNTTDPLAPFGVVTLHPRAGMGGVDFAGMRWSQTANYGTLPNPAMPNTFLAQAYDLHDPWNHGHVECTRKPREDELCGPYWENVTGTPVELPGFGGLHSRLKKPIGYRLAGTSTALVQPTSRLPRQSWLGVRPRSVSDGSGLWRRWADERAYYSRLRATKSADGAAHHF